MIASKHLYVVSHLILCIFVLLSSHVVACLCFFNTSRKTYLKFIYFYVLYMLADGIGLSVIVSILSTSIYGQSNTIVLSQSHWDYLNNLLG
ncbi:hypothetical protein ACJX0J_031077, partial [Zea mays]